MSRVRDSPSLPREPPDLRLAGPAAAAWLCALVLLGTHVAVALTVAAVAAALSVVVLWLRRWRRARWLLAATLVSAAATAVCCAGHLAVLSSGPVPRLAADGAEVHAELVVTGDPRRGEESGPAWQRGRTVTVPASLRLVEYGSSAHCGRQPVLVITRHEGWLSVTPGARVAVDAELDVPEDDGTLTSVVFARSNPRLVSRPPPVQRVAASLRAGLRESVSQLPADERGLIPGLVVGDTSQLTERVEAEFRRTGLTHLLAVSGANLAIVTGAILAVGRRVTASPRLLAVVAALGVVGFVVLARPEPSVLRAAVMGGVALLALGLGRPRRGLPALFTAVLVLVCLSPALARSYGFALSVLATFGLLVLAPPWRDRLAQRGCPRPLAEAIAIPAAAQVTCGPVIAMLAAQVNLVGVLANVLAAPAVPLVTVLGVLATAVHPVVPVLAELIGWCAWPPAWWLVRVGRVAAALPGASVSWAGGVTGGVTLALVTVGALLLLPYRPIRFLLATGTVAVLVTVGALHVTAPRWPPDGWRLVACDVGQGDGLVLRTGRSDAVVVDTGPDPAPMDGCLDRLDVERVPLLVVTYLHADHEGGVRGVLKGREVGTVVTTPLHSPPAQWSDLRRLTEGAGVRIGAATAGTRWRVGAITMRVLWPPPTATKVTVDETGDEESSEENDASLVIHASWPGMTALLTGDVEPDVQTELLASGADLGADVLKVPHHGSSRQHGPFFTAVGARLALVSAGVDNDYGHPAPRTLDALAARGAQVRRTDLDGDIAVLGAGAGELAVAVRGKERTRALSFGGPTGHRPRVLSFGDPAGHRPRVLSYGDPAKRPRAPSLDDPVVQRRRAVSFGDLAGHRPRTLSFGDPAGHRPRAASFGEPAGHCPRAVSFDGPAVERPRVLSFGDDHALQQARGPPPVLPAR